MTYIKNYKEFLEINEIKSLIKRSISNIGKKSQKIIKTAKGNLKNGSETITKKQNQTNQINDLSRSLNKKEMATLGVIGLSAAGAEVTNQKNLRRKAERKRKRIERIKKILPKTKNQI